MPGAFTTLPILDGGATPTLRNMRVWDESGAGTGPFSFASIITDGSGSAIALNNDGRTDPTHGAPVTPVAAAAFLACAANVSTHVIKNGAGAAGDYLESLLCIVTTPASSLVQIKDGAAGNAIDVLPNGVGGGVGVYPVPLGYRATAADGWTLVCGAGVKVLAGGDF